jgi:hypothetical protein
LCCPGRLHVGLAYSAGNKVYIIKTLVFCIHIMVGCMIT